MKKRLVDADKLMERAKMNSVLVTVEHDHHDYGLMLGTLNKIVKECELPSVQPENTRKHTETHACDLISRQALCEYALNQKDKNITANDIMRFPSAQPKSCREGYQAGYKDAQHESAKRTAEAAQNVSDEDLISRKEAIVAVCNSECESGFCGIPCPEVDALKALPSAQPKRKRGKWIYGEDEYGIDGYHCDKCGFFVPWDYAHKFINYIEDYNFCPNCGADMREGGKK